MTIFEQILQEVLDEKIIRVKHQTAKQRAKAKMFRIKNKAKLKKSRLKKKKLLKSKPKARPGYKYGADGKLHKVVRRKGVRRSK